MVTEYVQYNVCDRTIIVASNWKLEVSLTVEDQTNYCLHRCKGMPSANGNTMSSFTCNTMGGSERHKAWQKARQAKQHTESDSI